MLLSPTHVHLGEDVYGEGLVCFTSHVLYCILITKAVAIYYTHQSIKLDYHHM